MVSRPPLNWRPFSFIGRREADAYLISTNNRRPNSAMIDSVRARIHHCPLCRISIESAYLSEYLEFDIFRSLTCGTIREARDDTMP